MRKSLAVLLTKHWVIMANSAMMAVLAVMFAILVVFSESESSETLLATLMSINVVIASLCLLLDLLKFITFYQVNVLLFYYLILKMSLLTITIVLEIIQITFYPIKDDNYVTYHSFANVSTLFYLLLVFRLEVLKMPSEKRDDKKKQQKYVEQSIIPFDRVLWILNDLKSVIDEREEKTVKDIDYYIRIIANNKIFTPEYEDDEVEEIGGMSVVGKNKLNQQRVVS